MIEMRWRKASENDEDDFEAGYMMNVGYVVLQYRERVETHTQEIQGGFERPENPWSEWIDVPIEEGE